MYVVRVCVRFDYLDSFLFAQLSQYLPNIFFNLPAYCQSPIFWCKHHMILTSPRCVGQTIYVFAIAHFKDNLPVFGMWSETHILYYREVFFCLCLKLFYSTSIVVFCAYAINKNGRTMIYMNHRSAIETMKSGGPH